MILCLDYGSRYIGVAITDDDNRFALRHSVIDQKIQPALPALLALAESQPLSLILVGLPVSLSGNPSQQTKDTAEFIKQLRVALPQEIKIKTVDETLTSFEAERRLKLEGGNTNDAHSEAARIMLEEYIKTPRSGERGAAIT